MKVVGKEILTSVAMTSIAAAAPVAEMLSHSVTNVDDISDVTVINDVESGGEIDCEFRADEFAQQKFAVPGVEADLKLLKVPKIVVRGFSKLCIDDWGISVGVSEATPERLVSETIRTFTGHLRKAQCGALGGENRRIWRNLLRDFDSDDYMEASAPATSTVGFIKLKTKNYAIIAWSDDASDVDRVDGELLKRISFLREGDMFVALAKFVSGRLTQLDNVQFCDA